MPAGSPQRARRARQPPRPGRRHGDRVQQQQRSDGDPHRDDSVNGSIQRRAQPGRLAGFQLPDQVHQRRRRIPGQRILRTSPAVPAAEPSPVAPARPGLAFAAIWPLPARIRHGRPRRLVIHALAAALTPCRWRCHASQQ